MAPVVAMADEVVLPVFFRSLESVGSMLLVSSSSWAALVMSDRWARNEAERVAARGCHSTSGDTGGACVGGVVGGGGKRVRMKVGKRM